MTEPRNDDRSQARREAAALLNVDIDHMSPADGLRIDMISALRLVIDHEQGCVLSGGSADLGKLNVAVSSLIALLPGRELPAPESQHEDPRQVMWEIYRTMRERGEINLKPEAGLHLRIDELEGEVAALRAKLAGGPLAITPPLSDIVPPSERAERDVGPQRGADDPPPRSTTVIEGSRAERHRSGVANRAPAAPPSRPPQWDDTPSGKAWNEWRDAGGYGGGDPWANNNR
jgi:hypothetical protein